MKKTLFAMALVAASIGIAQAAPLLSENFDDVSTLTGKGWVRNNQSTPLGTTNWFQGNPTVFAAASGAPNSYIAANFNNARTGGVVSNWLLTPTVGITSRETLNFALRLFGDDYLDTVEVYLSTNGSSTTLTDFVLLQTYASDFDTGWTNETIIVDGSGTGRFAFRYFVDNTNINGNYIGIDNVTVDIPEPTSTALFGIAILGLALSRRRSAAKIASKK